MNGHCHASSSVIQAASACIGSEITAVAAGETKNPKKALPSAIRKVAVRICLFYIMSTVVIGLIVPSNDPALGVKGQTASSSPFVIALNNAEVKVMPS